MSGALETQGTKLYIGNNASPIVYTQVKELVSFQAFDGQANEIDTTSLDSTAKEFLMGLQDNGSFSGEFNWLPADTGQVAMRAAKASRAITHFRLTMSDTSKFEFDGYVLGAPISGGVDAKVDGSFAIRITGAVAFTPAP
jgi:hypothetical protein